MGILSALSPWLLSQQQSPIPGVPIVPFAPNVPPEGAGAPAPRFATGPAVPPFGAKAASQPQPGGLRGGFGRLTSSLQDGSLFESPMLQAGLSLLGHGSSGGNWADVARDLQQQGRQRFQRQRETNEERRLKVAEGREQTVWDERQQTRAARDAWWRGLTPEQRAAYGGDIDTAYQAFATQRAQRDFGTPEQVIADGFIWTRNPDGTLARGEEIPLSAAERARIDAYVPRGSRLTAHQVTSARANFATAQGLQQSYDNFVNLLRNATPQDLAGIGEGGARLQAAHRLLAIQAKSPAALDLGALVGADFSILNDIIGEPGNIRQLVQQGGARGALARLEPFGTFIRQGQGRLRSTYEPYADQFADIYSQPPPTLPDQAPPPPGDGASVRVPGASPRTPPPQAIAELRRDSSAQARREFDEIFGPGAAARALSGGYDNPYMRPDGPMTRG